MFPAHLPPGWRRRSSRPGRPWQFGSCLQAQGRVEGREHGHSVKETSRASRLSFKIHLCYSHLPATALGERVESPLKKLQTLLVCLKTGGADRKCSLQENQRGNPHCEQTVEHFEMIRSNTGAFHCFSHLEKYCRLMDFRQCHFRCFLQPCGSCSVLLNA